MSKFPKRIDARLEIKITESPETDPKRIALERRMNRAGAVCVLSLIALAVVITILCNVYLCEFLVYLLIVLFLVSVISGSISWSARQALDGDWTMPWWMGNPPPAQQTAPVPPPLWVEVRARFRFCRVPWCPMTGAAEFNHCHAVFFCNEVSFRKTRYTIEYP